MDRMLYVAMSGAKQLMQAQAVNANNLANASTAGFRQDLAAARAMPAFGEGLPSRVYAMTERTAVDMRPGPITHTGRGLDVAVDGPGWIAVQAPDGSEAYTRAGDLTLTPEGLLTTSAGHPVLGDGGPIAIPPADQLAMGTDGTISILPQGDPGGLLVEVERIRLVNPEAAGLYKGADGLIHQDADLPPPVPDAAVRLSPESLEGSNVEPVAALVGMIDLSRRYELQVKLMQAARENDGASDRLLRLE